MRRAYGYDPNTGDPTTVTYSDGTPSVTTTYNRLGQRATVSDASGTRIFGYDPATLRLESEILPHFNGERLTYTYENGTGNTVPGRFSGYRIGTEANPTAIYAAGWSFDTAGRIARVEGPGLNGGHVAYAYVSGAPNLIETRIVFDASGAAVASTVHTLEPRRNNVTKILNQTGSTRVSEYTYSYNQVSQRKQKGNSGTAFEFTSHFAYGYDLLGQVIIADRFEGVDFANPGAQILPESFGYDYDHIGNRLHSSFGSPELVEGQLATAYTPNLLNQYTAIQPGDETTIEPIHDADGNLLEQAGWTYRWNGENRLIEAKVANPVDSSARRLIFKYDGDGRRVEKRVYAWDESAWAPLRMHIFVWAGWDMLLEKITDETTSTASLTKYLWGLDIAGSTDATGNVGALLALDTGDTQGIYFYDANGNVGQVVDLESGELLASYEYSPFGEVIFSTGLLAETNRFRFSTKYQDTRSGFLYYGYRYYSPTTGRWLNRDPIGEAGGINLYAFVGNDGVSLLDRLGKVPVAPFLGSFLKDCSKSVIKNHLLKRLDNMLRRNQIVHFLSAHADSSTPIGRNRAIQTHNISPIVSSAFSPSGFVNLISKCLLKQGRRAIKKKVKDRFPDLPTDEMIDASEQVLKDLISLGKGNIDISIEYTVFYRCEKCVAGGWEIRSHMNTMFEVSAGEDMTYVEWDINTFTDHFKVMPGQNAFKAAEAACGGMF